MNRIGSIITGTWAKIKKQPIPFLFLALAIILKLIRDHQRFAIGWVEWPPWTGFGEYWITKVDPVTDTTTEIEIHYRTLWDLVQLLSIPVVLALAAAWFNRAENDRNREIAAERSKTERRIVLDSQLEVALQTYVDRMTDLLLREDGGLRDSAPDDEIRTVARTRTLMTLRNLDGWRKGLLVRFLHEGRLIDKGNSIVRLWDADLGGAGLFLANLSAADLSGSDLSKADLVEAVLTKVDLRGADLREADLRFAKLHDANLSDARLNEADLSGANLSEANLSDADLSRVVYDDHTTWPTGFTPPPDAITATEREQTGS
jgi:hypothetical protein